MPTQSAAGRSVESASLFPYRLDVQVIRAENLTIANITSSDLTWGENAP